MSIVIADLAPDYAETFTTEELEAQIAFYRTPLGRQIAGKAVELGIAQEAVLQEAMVAFLAEVESKYCAEFNCGTMAAGRPPSRSASRPVRDSGGRCRPR